MAVRSSGTNPRELAKSIDAVTRRVKNLKKDLEKLIKNLQKTYAILMFCSPRVRECDSQENITSKIFY